MSLINDFKAICVLLKEVSVSDWEGGSTSQWVEGDTFVAAITYDTSREERAAEKRAARSLHTVTTELPFVLNYHDVFKCVADGRIFRVTSDGDKQTPARASFQIAQVTAEEYSLPDGGVTV